MQNTIKKDCNGHKADDENDCYESKLLHCHNVTPPGPGRQCDRYRLWRLFRCGPIYSA